MRVAQHGREPAGQRGVDQNGVEICGNLWCGQRHAPVRYAIVQIGERFFVAERLGLRHELRQKVERAVGLPDEGVEMVAVIEAAAFPFAFD